MEEEYELTQQVNIPKWFFNRSIIARAGKLFHNIVGGHGSIF